MPDIWTERPDIVRDLLREAGFTCGVEPRILEGRDPDWTCIIDGDDMGVSMGTVELALFGALVAALLVVLWETWVIIKLKRRLAVPE